MKYLIIHILFIILLSSCKDEHKCVDILYVDMDIETPIRINTYDFPKFFHSEIDSVRICKSEDVNRLINALDSLPLAEQEEYSLPDIRIKISILKNTESSGNIDVYIGRFTILKEDKLYVVSNNLKDILSSIGIVPRSSW